MKTDNSIYELVNSQLLELDEKELILVHEMINHIKRPGEKKEPIKFDTKIFIEVQQALQGIPGNFSDDIINIEREEMQVTM